MVVAYGRISSSEVLGCIIGWLLLFLEYEFIVIYKPGHTHVVANALSRILDIIELIGVLDQTTYVTLFML